MRLFYKYVVKEKLKKGILVITENVCLLLMLMKRMLRNEKSFNVWNSQKGDAN